MLKIVAILIVAFMAFSMIAAGLLYVQTPSKSNNQNPGDSTLPEPTGTPFTYNVSFDSNAIKELDSIKVAPFTISSDKASIDSAIMKIDGVARISSQFKKPALDANEWYYIADISLKKSADSTGVVQKIFDLNFFDQSKRIEFFAAKYITILPPPYVMLHNTDLNIDRNYSFDSTTLSALANLSTSAGDNLVISGSIQLQGKTVLSLSLAEERNLSKEKFIDTNNIIIDTNSLVVDVNKSGADSNK
jgi:hypothetical protein